MAGLVKRAKRSWRRLGRSLRHRVREALPPSVRRVAGGPASYVDLLFVDHGIFRMLYSNSHRISDKAWRSAQPAPHQIRRFAKVGIRTIAEFVETKETLAKLREIGVDYVQGFGIARPEPINKIP